MDPKAALHNAARHYCLRESERLRVAGLESGHSSAFAQDLGRSAALLDAIRVVVETFVPEDFSSIDEARAFLSEAGRTARIWPPVRDTSEHPHSDAARARIGFSTFVERSRENDWALAPALPYRRALTTPEREAIDESFRSHWGSWYGGSASGEIPTNETFHVDLLDELPGRYDGLERILRDRGVTRVIQLHEYGESFDVDLALAIFHYTGAETFCFERSMRWMIYASHESSITFGGEWLIEAIHSLLPDAWRWVYRGWGTPPLPEKSQADD